jgi:hypothetical protein
LNLKLKKTGEFCMSLPQKNERSNFELFQSRLENIVASHHELVMLSHLIDWHKLEKIFGAFFIPKRAARDCYAAYGRAFVFETRQ